MTIRTVLSLIAALLACAGARADRVAGIAGIAPARIAAPQPSSATLPVLTGVVSGLRADGSQVEIDGKWYVLKQGRTLVLRKGLAVGASALAKGQKLSYRLASTTPGEQALGLIHVP